MGRRRFGRPRLGHGAGAEDHLGPTSTMARGRVVIASPRALLGRSDITCQTTAATETAAIAGIRKHLARSPRSTQPCGHRWWLAFSLWGHAAIPIINRVVHTTGAKSPLTLSTQRRDMCRYDHLPIRGRLWHRDAPFCFFCHPPLFQVEGHRLRQLLVTRSRGHSWRARRNVIRTHHHVMRPAPRD